MMEKSDSYAKAKEEWYQQRMPEVPETTIHELIEESVDIFPERTALVFLDTSMTYLEFNKLCNRLANALADLGIEKGDRVATMLPNSFQSMISFFAINKLGAIPVPMNVMFKKDELVYHLEDSGAKSIITLDKHYPIVEQADEEINLNNIIVTNLADLAPEWREFQGELMDEIEVEIDPERIPDETRIYWFEELILDDKYDGPPPDVDIDPKEDPCILLYTAGTTGLPKGVVLTHYNFVYNTILTSVINAPESLSQPDSKEDRFEFRKRLKERKEKDVNLVLFPQFHISGYMLSALPMLFTGGEVILCPRFEPKEYLRLMDKYDITIFCSPPPAYLGFLFQSDFEDYDLSNLRMCIGCGAPVPEEIQKQWQDATGHELLDGYGLTETTATATSSNRKKKKLDSIGAPMGGELKIVNDEGEVIPRGENGEILYRGPQVAKEYWNKPEETEKSFEESGWFHTGDIGYMDEDDFIHFVDRKKDIIVASGYNISPSEVENIMLKHSSVKEVGCIGIPHEYRGETVKAFVVLEEGADISEEELIDWSEEHMAAYKYPREIEFIDELPKSETLKVLRRELRKREGVAD